MSFLVPYHLALKSGEEALYRAYLLADEPDIPNDTYQLQEWYCPNPDCHCQEASLEVVSIASKCVIAHIWVNLDPTKKPHHRPDLSGGPDPLPYAQALFKQIAQNLNSDLAYLYRLRSHYHQVKAMAADPSHPSHSALIRWGETGGRQPPAIKRKRRRH